MEDNLIFGEFTSRQIIELNTRFARFMGAEIVETKTSILPIARFKDAPGINKKYSGFELNYLEYHNSMDWLMEVVDKIETLNAQILQRNFLTDQVSACMITVFEDMNDEPIKTIVKRADTRKAATYKAVLSFIDWYNLENA